MNKLERPPSQDLNNNKTLPQTVIVLGFVSFFNDFASDIVIPLIPILLASVLAAGPIALVLLKVLQRQ